MPKSTSEFFEQYQDPRWQKKRLKIMERDNFACVKCLDSESKLNVHHVCYRRNLPPWDYPSFLLVTLCDRCHADCHVMNENILSTFSHVANSVIFLFTQTFPSSPDGLTDTEITRILIALFQDEQKWKEIQAWYSSLPLDRQLNKIEEER